MAMNRAVYNCDATQKIIYRKYLNVKFISLNSHSLNFEHKFTFYKSKVKQVQNSFDRRVTKIWSGLDVKAA